MKRSIPITLITTELTVGGAEKCLVNLAVRLDQEKFRPSVVSLKSPPDKSQSQLVTQLEEAGISIQFLNLQRGIGFPFAVWKLSRFLKRESSELVVSFLYHANSISSCARRLVRVPHQVAGIRVADPRKSRHRFERWCSRNIDKFVCVSKSVERFSHEVARLPTEKLMTIHNGVDVEKLDNIELVTLESAGVQSGRRAITFVGRLHEQKGLIEFLCNVPELLARIPEHDLLLIGEGPLHQELQELIAEKKLEQRVHLVGWRKDALGLVKASDLLVLPSRWEGMPNVVMEAMALSKPIVAFDVEGVTELLGSEGESIQICQQGDFAALQANIAQIIGNETLTRDLGDQNRERIIQTFTLKKMIQQYESLFLTLTET